jgi:hypothetical protein
MMDVLGGNVESRCYEDMVTSDAVIRAVARVNAYIIWRLHA